MKNNTLLALGMFEKPQELLHFKEPKTSGIISDIAVIRSVYEKIPEQQDALRVREELFKQYKDITVDLNLNQFSTIDLSSPTQAANTVSDEYHPTDVQNYVSKAVDFVKEIISEFRHTSNSKVLVSQF